MTISGNMRILELLAQGISPVQVVSIVGCSAEYIKNLLVDEDFKSAVEAKAAEYCNEANEEEIISNKYLSVENAILKRISSEIGNVEFKDAVRALEVVGARQDKIANRKHTGSTHSNTANVNVVMLQIPQHAVPEYTLNSNSEVVAIGDKAMSPMTSDGVKQLFSNLQNNIKDIKGEVVA